MNKVFAIFSILFIICAVNTGFAYNNFDPCTGSRVAHDRWFFSVNNSNQSSKEDILAALTLMSAEGFSLTRVGKVQWNQSVRVFRVTFNPNAYMNVQQADRAKEVILSTFSRIPGCKVECDPLAEH